MVGTVLAFCPSLLVLPRPLVPLVFKCLAILRRRGQPLLLVELGRAKGQEKISGDFIVAENNSLSGSTDGS